MFSTKEYLDKKTGPYGIGRLSYLQALVNEFQETKSESAKEEVLANLANFSYDPINYDFLRRLGVIDLFLDNLTENNTKLVQFAAGGICNICLDKENKEYILKNDGVHLLKQCLVSDDEDTVMSAITSLMYLVTPQSKPEITSPPVVAHMTQLSTSPDKRISNLATVFLQDYCSEEQRTEGREAIGLTGHG
ncbi:unnamed protein product [Owenia fusiformis]|uniref:Uncharacterized protein n=1 Tax=Owenia fusiformis TaxID=6347 RepID=A0A8J1U835_OWEFU|nr:unnamed protein product [Owenia fusiformis]